MSGVLRIIPLILGWEELPKSFSVYGADPDVRLREPVPGILLQLDGGWMLLDTGFNPSLIRDPLLYQRFHGSNHNIAAFLPPGDVLWSFGKVLVFAVTVILIHCYYGYNASGGPAGVGVAVGKAVRTSIVAINVIDLFLSMAIWGATTTVRLAG